MPHSVWMGDLPVRAFHGEDDEPVPAVESHRMVEAINRLGGNAKLTLYPDTGHDAWARNYANPAVWDWLFLHRQSDRL